MRIPKDLPYICCDFPHSYIGKLLQAAVKYSHVLRIYTQKFRWTRLKYVIIKHILCCPSLTNTAFYTPTCSYILTWKNIPFGIMLHPGKDKQHKHFSEGLVWRNLCWSKGYSTFKWLWRSHVTTFIVGSFSRSTGNQRGCLILQVQLKTVSMNPYTKYSKPCQISRSPSINPETVDCALSPAFPIECYLV